MSKKVFAIRKGRNPETGEEVVNKIIEAPWEVVKYFVTGVPGAIYKGFTNREDAEIYLREGTKEKYSSSPSNSTSAAHVNGVLYCYVDGSYNKKIPNYGYGLVCVKNGKVLDIYNGNGTNEDAIQMRQIGGELLGAMKALLYAKRNKHSKVVIYHDYIGVKNHATGEWKCKNEFSKIYHDWMQDFFNKSPQIDIEFKKVDAHTGDDFNELADGYAKLAVGIKPNPIFYRMAEKHQIPIENN